MSQLEFELHLHTQIDEYDHRIRENLVGICETHVYLHEKLTHGG